MRITISSLYSVQNKNPRQFNLLCDEIGKQLYHEWGQDFARFQSIKSTEELVKIYKTKQAQNPQTGPVPICFVVHSEDEFIGTASIDTQDIALMTHFSPWLANVFVMPEYRGKGIGSILVKHVLDYAKNILNIPYLYLWTSTHEHEEWFTTFGFKTDNSICHGDYNNIITMKHAF